MDIALESRALSVIASATKIDGTLAWIVNPGGRVFLGYRRDVEIVNMAMDYGQTGIVFGLAETAKLLDDDQVLDAAKKAADFIVKNIVNDDNGCKSPRIVYLKRYQEHPLHDSPKLRSNHLSFRAGSVVDLQQSCDGWSG